jgi:hypothetical protein
MRKSIKDITARKDEARKEIHFAARATKEPVLQQMKKN